MDDIKILPLDNPKTLVGESLILRDITLDDVNERYLAWMNDAQVTQFLESRFQAHTLENLREFVQFKIENKSHRMFAITIKASSLHIGNIVIGPISWRHRRAEVGIMIGDLNQSGKGYATEAISLLRDYAFKNLNLRKLGAGCYIMNKGSIRAFQKVGFEIEGTLKKHSLYNGEYMDCFLLASFAK